MLPIILTDNARKRIEEIEKCIMTFRVWGVNPPGHLAIEVFFEDKRFPGIEYEKFQDENLIIYIPTNHYDYINGVTVDFSGWSEEDESSYNSDKTFNHRGFECLPHKVETSEIRLSWIEVNGIIKKIFSMNYESPFYLQRQAAAINHLRFKKDEEDEDFQDSLFSFIELEQAVQAGFY